MHTKALSAGISGGSNAFRYGSCPGREQMDRFGILFAAADNGGSVLLPSVPVCLLAAGLLQTDKSSLPHMGFTLTEKGWEFLQRHGPTIRRAKRLDS